ncbi:MAG: hemerythrin domain-containing protein [Syntrophobacteraceae bacterium]
MERKMMPVAPLMIEHRVIERMIRVMGQELARIEKTGEVDPGFVDTAVDFIRTYTDHCHHGKEEDILFRDLQNKPLSDDLRKILDELIEEHRQGRRIVGELVEAKGEYIRGKVESISKITACMRYLVDFYPVHIEKEDRHFFLPCMRYFTQEEKDAMLMEEYDFDRNLVHDKYKAIVKSAEESSAAKE